MTTIVNIAQRILDENNYTESNISLVNLEYLIKNATDYINLMTEHSISFTPAAGVASLTATDAEIITTKFLTTLLLTERANRGPNASIQGLTVASLQTNPTYEKMIDKALERLKELPIVIANDPLPNE